MAGGRLVAADGPSGAESETESSLKAGPSATIYLLFTAQSEGRHVPQSSM